MDTAANKAAWVLPLSICIPTFNFGEFIGATLESIIRQNSESIEIIVLDGASTDNTEAVVQEAQTRAPNIKYYKQGERGGIDRDMARVVELAVGRHCWLFSADDLMESKSIDRVLELIRSDCDVYLCKHTMCTLDMKVLSVREVVDSAVEVEFDFGTAAEKERYFSLAESTEAFFSFMGGIIVKRSAWSSIPLNEAYIGSCWAHVARLMQLMGSGLRLDYLPEPLLHRRGDNDSFSDRGVVSRYAIAIDGYHRLASDFLGVTSECAFHVRRVLRNEFGLRAFLYAKLCCWERPAVESSERLDSLIATCYVDAPLRGSVIRFLCDTIAGRCYFLGRNGYRRLRKATFGW